MRAAFDLRELLERVQGGDDPPAIGMGALIGALVVFCRTGRPDLVARADGQLGSSTITYGYGGYIGWYERAVNEARAALGDQRYEALAAEGSTLPFETFVDEMIANLNEFLADAGAKSTARSAETSP